MQVEQFIEALGCDFYTGVPDSLLRPLCDYLMECYGTDGIHHIIAANEGNCVGLAAGYHLATGKTPVVYLQNSGEGNLINPIASLLHRKVYAIPTIFVIGWRGEPGVHDEPQHIYQGEVTLRLLDEMQIGYFVIDKQSTIDEVRAALSAQQQCLSAGGQFAFVVRKGGLTTEKRYQHQNDYAMTREQAIDCIVQAAGKAHIVSTTGKASRELFELREKYHQGHGQDFLTVGSMGHSSSIALGLALQKPQQKIICIDGDGAVLMHMGAMAVIGAQAPQNLVHIVINNGAHESVGGMPTVAAGNLDLVAAARACGYPSAVSVQDEQALNDALRQALSENRLCLIEVKTRPFAREDLGRPTRTPIENKQDFMKSL